MSFNVEAMLKEMHFERMFNSVLSFNNIIEPAHEIMVLIT